MLLFIFLYIVNNAAVEEQRQMKVFVVFLNDLICLYFFYLNQIAY